MLLSNSPRQQRIRAQQAAAATKRDHTNLILALALLPVAYMTLYVFMIGAGL